MTIQEAIDRLSQVPENKRNLPLYVCDLETSNNYEVSNVSLYDDMGKHDEENMLAIDFN